MPRSTLCDKRNGKSCSHSSVAKSSSWNRLPRVPKEASDVEAEGFLASRLSLASTNQRYLAAASPIVMVYEAV